MAQSIYSYEIHNPDGSGLDLSQYKGRVMLIVNTATECGLAPQFEGLEELYQQYKDEGLVVLGFPSNQFNQEPESNDAMTETCRINHGVTFPLTEKIRVNGEDTDPLFEYLKDETSGLISDQIKWNFTKFLIDKNGIPVKRYAPTTKPQTIKQDIEELL